MMRSDETRQRCRDPEVKRPGQLLIQLQRAEWDPLGVDQDLGCKVLDELDKHFPGDPSIVQERNEFVFTAQRTYLQSVEDRKPESLETKKPLPRDKIIEFFDACNTKMDLPETRERLLKHMQDTKKIPNQVIIEMQRDLLELIGYERDHGCAMLSNIPKDFPSDMELHRRFQHWQMCAQQACHQVVAQYRNQGGDLPKANWVDNFNGSPELQKLWKQANEEVGAMTPKERGELLMEKQKKVETFMQLPPEARHRHMERISDDEKVELMKVQVLAINMMRQQWQQAGQGHAPHCPNHGHQQAPGADSEPPKAPPQQQMM